MSIISESLTIGLLLSLVFGALFFYIYSRVTYVEKRISLMENILLDIKISQEQMPSHVLPQVPPIVRFQEVASVPHLGSMGNLEHDEVLPQFLQQLQPTNEGMNNEIKEELHEMHEVEEAQESMYSSVLEEAHRATPEEVVSEPEPTKVTINYESMTKDELIEVAKQKGLRTGNRPGREKLLQLIRNSEELKPQALQAVEEVEI